MKKIKSNFLLRFADNASHCLVSLISTKRFSNFPLLNKAFTFLSTYQFISCHFRFWSSIWFLASFALSVGTALWKFSSATPYAMLGVDVPTVSFAVSLASLLVSMLWRILSFHKYEVYGPSTTKDHILDDTFVTSSAPTALKMGRVHFDKVIERDADHPVFRIRGEGVENLIEFDLTLSQHLLNNDLYFHRNKELFEINEKEILEFSRQWHASMIRAFIILRNRSMSKGQAFFNAKKISLRKLDFEDTPDGRRTVGHVGTTSYFLSAITNDVACSTIRKKSSDSFSEELWGLLPLVFDQVTGTDQWMPLELGKMKALSNHVGCVVLAVSSDSVPILCIQDAKSRIAGGRYVLSGAGSLEYSDVLQSQAKKSRNMGDFIRFGMARELLEETMDIPQDSHRQYDKKRIREFSKNIRVAGYYRDFKRGGFPIFFGFAKLDVDYETLTTRRAPKVCFWANAGETSVNAGDRTAVRTPEDMLGYLLRYIDSDVMPKRRVSDQVLVMQKLLENDVVKQHLKQVLDAPRP